MFGRFVILLLVSGSLWPDSAQADTSYFGDGDQEVQLTQEGSRTKNQKLAILGVFGAGLLAGGVATYFALDSQSLSDEISASGDHTRKVWTPAFEDKHARAARSRTVAQVGYGVAGGLAVAGIVALLVTAPDDVPAQSLSFSPRSGGLVVGQSWSF